MPCFRDCLADCSRRCPRGRSQNFSGNGPGNCFPTPVSPHLAEVMPCPRKLFAYSSGHCPTCRSGVFREWPGECQRAPKCSHLAEAIPCSKNFLCGLFRALPRGAVPQFPRHGASTLKQCLLVGISLRIVPGIPPRVAPGIFPERPGRNGPARSSNAFFRDYILWDIPSCAPAIAAGILLGMSRAELADSRVYPHKLSNPGIVPSVGRGNLPGTAKGVLADSHVSVHL